MTEMLSHETCTGLVELPFELIHEVVAQLSFRRDLVNLALTCHALERVTRPFLYSNIIIQDFPISDARPDSLFWTKSIVVKERRHGKAREGCSNRSNRAEAIDGKLGNDISLIPRNQLISFTYELRRPFSQNLFESLFEYHSQSLRELYIFDMENLWRPLEILPNRLSTIHCRSIQTGSTIAKLVKHNRETIRCLRLGDELLPFPQYPESYVNYVRTQSDYFMKNFLDIAQIQVFPSLKVLEINNINLHPLAMEITRSTPQFHQLQRIVLESCAGSAEFLRNMASSFKLQDNKNNHPTSLKHFLFRHELVSSELREALLTFLASFHGLETLSVLLENTTILETVPSFICAHGPTLRTLVLECRTSPRLTVRHDTSRPFGSGGHSRTLWDSSIDDIARLCPNLEELGTSFPWDDGDGDETTITPRKNYLASLPRLQTLHIRNFPQSAQTTPFGEYGTKTLATRFLDRHCCSSPSPSRPPPLDTLAIGPTVYESRFPVDGGGGSRTRIPPGEFLRTHYFVVDWVRTRFGECVAIPTPVSEPYVEAARGLGRLGGVFEPVWVL